MFLTQNAFAECETYEGTVSCGDYGGEYGIPSGAEGSISFSQTVCDGVWGDPVQTGGECYVPEPPPPPAPACETYSGSTDCASVAGEWGIPAYLTSGSVTYTQTVCDGVWEDPVQTGGSCSAPSEPETPCTKTNACGTHTTSGTAAYGVCNAPEPNVDNSCIETCTDYTSTESCAAAIDRLEARDGSQDTYFGYPGSYTEGTVTYTQRACTQNGNTTWYWPTITSGSCSASAPVNPCSSGYVWDGSQCVVPAPLAGCMDPNYAANGNYNPSATASDTCSCNSGYAWNGSMCQAGVPETPGGLTATPASCGSGQINVAWSTSGGATTYTLRDGATVIYVGSVASFSHTSLTANSSHSYTVSAANTGGSSAYSGAVNATAPASCAASPCGSAATSYSHDATSYSGSFCNSGASSPASPSFPAQGGTVSWMCSGVACFASRNNVPFGCGAAHATPTQSQPTTNLCTSGTVNWTDAAASDGTYNWSCAAS